jgi:hypothetical protein
LRRIERQWRLTLSQITAPEACLREVDYTSKEGAERLKSAIEGYWQQRGFDVRVVLHNAGFHSAVRAARYDLRSDMRNGLPTPETKTHAVLWAED